MNVSKKVFLGLIYIYISIAALSAENILSVGLSFPTLKFDKDASRSGTTTVKGLELPARANTLSDTKLQGTQVTVGLKHIFDNRFVLGGDLGVGEATLKLNGTKDTADYLFADLNLSLGAAIVNTDRVTLILSGFLGARVASMDDTACTICASQKWNFDKTPAEPVEIDKTNAVSWDESGRYLAFNIGAEIFANFRIGKTAGLFASCKVANSSGNLKKKYRDNVSETSSKVTYKRTTALAITPSVGVSFKI